MSHSVLLQEDPITRLLLDGSALSVSRRRPSVPHSVVLASQRGNCFCPRGGTSEHPNADVHGPCFNNNKHAATPSMSKRVHSVHSWDCFMREAIIERAFAQQLLTHMTKRAKKRGLGFSWFSFLARRCFSTVRHGRYRNSEASVGEKKRVILPRVLLSFSQLGGV